MQEQAPINTSASDDAPTAAVTSASIPVSSSMDIPEMPILSSATLDLLRDDTDDSVNVPHTATAPAPISSWKPTATTMEHLSLSPPRSYSSVPASVPASQQFIRHITAVASPATTNITNANDSVSPPPAMQAYPSPAYKDPAPALQQSVDIPQFNETTLNLLRAPAEVADVENNTSSDAPSSTTATADPSLSSVAQPALTNAPISFGSSAFRRVASSPKAVTTVLKSAPTVAPALQEVTEAEYAQIPAFLSAHFTLSELNDCIQMINKILTEKHSSGADSSCASYDELSLHLGSKAKAAGAVLTRLNRLELQRKEGQLSLAVKM